MKVSTISISKVVFLQLPKGQIRSSDIINGTINLCQNILIKAAVLPFYYKRLLQNVRTRSGLPQVCTHAVVMACSRHAAALDSQFLV